MPPTSAHTSKVRTNPLSLERSVLSCPHTLQAHTIPQSAGHYSAKQLLPPFVAGAHHTAKRWQSQRRATATQPPASTAVQNRLHYLDPTTRPRTPCAQAQECQAITPKPTSVSSSRCNVQYSLPGALHSQLTTLWHMLLSVITCDAKNSKLTCRNTAASCAGLALPLGPSVTQLPVQNPDAPSTTTRAAFAQHPPRQNKPCTQIPASPVTIPN